ncbi:MAG: ABC transporter permease [Clostridiales bacterium]|nr:ABC transporter permease [Clostridiales bacterium]
MKKYLSFFRIRFQAGLQYRAAAFAGVATQFAWGFMLILMYRAFYRSGNQAFPMEFHQLSSYIWMQQALLALFMTWFFDGEIFDHITSGSVAYELCRPCELYGMWFVKNMAIRLSRVVLRCIPIFLVAALLPSPLGLTLPASAVHAAMFPFALLLGFLVMVSLSMLVYIGAFYTLSPVGIRIMAGTAMEFLCGGIIPIPFFPQWMQRIMALLPFGSIQNTPFLIYTGVMQPVQALKSMFIQLIWLGILLLIGSLSMRHALKKVVVQGG